MRKFVQVVMILSLAIGMTVSMSLACDGGPGCTCPGKDKTKTASMDKCDHGCKKACEPGTKTAMMDHNCEDGCIKPCCTDNKLGNVWKTDEGMAYFTCPVEKTVVKVSDAVSYSDVNGVRYYHCCSGCEEPFQANSAMFIENLAIPGNVVSVDKNGKQMFVDPINSKSGTVGDKTKFCDYDGKRFYFTSKKSMKKFKKDPDVYFSMAN